MRRVLALELIVVVLTGPTVAAEDALAPSAAVRAELAPTGALRVVLLVGNPVLVLEREGALSGVSVDLGRALADTLGVPFVPVRYPSMAAILASATAGEWDVAFIAADPARTEVAFTAAYMEVDNTLLVPAGSPIRTFADMDRPGGTIAVQERDTADLYLSRTLRQARLVRVTHAVAFELLAAGRVDAYAANRHRLTELQATLPGSRVLDGWFLALQLMIDGDWTQAIYLDDRANESQRNALERVFTGGAGGTWAILARFVTNRLDTRVVPIRFEDAGRRKSMRIEGCFDTTIDAIRGAEKGREAVLDNVSNQIHASTQTLALGTTRYADRTLAFDTTDTRALYSRFSWSGP